MDVQANGCHFRVILSRNRKTCTTPHPCQSHCQDEALHRLILCYDLGELPRNRIRWVAPRRASSQATSPARKGGIFLGWSAVYYSTLRSGWERDIPILNVFGLAASHVEASERWVPPTRLMPPPEPAGLPATAAIGLGRAGAGLVAIVGREIRPPILGPTGVLGWSTPATGGNPQWYRL